MSHLKALKEFYLHRDNSVSLLHAQDVSYSLLILVREMYSLPCTCRYFKSGSSLLTTELLCLMYLVNKLLIMYNSYQQLLTKQNNHLLPHWLTKKCVPQAPSRLDCHGSDMHRAHLPAVKIEIFTSQHIISISQSTQM